LYQTKNVVTSSNPPDDNLYRIGTVASLTGISVERLRAWERRYQFGPAHKSGKTRFYSKPQVDRLKLIKHLIDHGHPISSLAALSHEQLSERIENEVAQPVPRKFGFGHTPKIGLIGANLLLLEQQLNKEASNQEFSQVEVVSRWANMQAFEAEQSAADEPQILVMQLPVLAIQPIDLAREFFPEAKIVVIYNFATSNSVSQTQRLQVPALKWPVTWSEVENVCVNEGGSAERSGRVQPRRYSDEELIAIASTSTDDTQCPEFLVEAINQLNAFATYAAECMPARDRVALYEQVHADATNARAQLETALETLLGQSPETPTKAPRTTH
jgi:DNA-binding transcriptional MerR regulator